jgi:hypothetical protein
MDKFILSERFRLELKWKQAIYNIDGLCEFKDAYFCGPALLDALQLNNNDHILLDFYTQYIVVVENVYVAKFSWGEVVYNGDGTILLKDAIMSHDTELNKVPKLKNNDYLVIDTQNHEVEKHSFNFVYKTYVVNETTSLYKFGR